ncbi:hypothetical protein B0H13DRAFT_1903147 [Mycena leptocephala]|nr:hypothetical protein B0H13DRAFT_1903147 [Mycena leptocephala]
MPLLPFALNGPVCTHAYADNDAELFPATPPLPLGHAGDARVILPPGIGAKRGAKADAAGGHDASAPRELRERTNGNASRTGVGPEGAEQRRQRQWGADGEMHMPLGSDYARMRGRGRARGRGPVWGIGERELGCRQGVILPTRSHFVSRRDLTANVTTFAWPQDLQAPSRLLSTGPSGLSFILIAEKLCDSFMLHVIFHSLRSAPMDDRFSSLCSIAVERFTCRTPGPPPPPSKQMHVSEPYPTTRGPRRALSKFSKILRRLGCHLSVAISLFRQHRRHVHVVDSGWRICTIGLS